MNEGVFRILRALGHGQVRARSAVIRDSSESHSMLAELEGSKAKWFSSTGPEVGLNAVGLAALARELTARRPPNSPDALAQRFHEIAQSRPPVRRELDQVLATPDTTLRRARWLIERGDAQRGVLFVGDDDLTSVALKLALLENGADRSVRALDIDPAIVEIARASGVEAIEHDLREPLPRDLVGKVGCVFTDPPYALNGFRLFLSRSVEALKPDGRVCVCFGTSRRASERGLQKQRVISELGLFVEEVIPDFNQYDGAESIGASSALWVARRTPQTRAVVEGREEGELYTRTSETADAT